MSAIPAVAATGHHQWIPLAKLSASPLNHRKTFDPAKMAELADSIRSKGVIQPILARPLGEAFEVVAGERRFRAAKAAKLVDIPAIVREMSDTEALELQVIENGQRVDPHPLEEAEGYEALMKCTTAAGERYTAEQIRRVKVSSLFDKDYKPAKLQHPLTGEFIDVVTQQAVAAAAQRAKRAKPTHTNAARKPKMMQRKPEQIFRERLFAAICAKLPAQLGREEWRAIARDAIDASGVGHELIIEIFFPSKVAKEGAPFQTVRRNAEAGIASADVATLSRLVLAASLGSEVEYAYGQPKKLLEAAKRYKVDPAQVKRAIADEAKAKEVEAKKAKVAAKPKRSTSRESTAARDFMKPHTPSAELAEIVGNKAMPRTEVTSKLWGYIKKHGLQDKTNRRMINADAKLLPIFGGKKQVSMFDMTKFVVKHLSRA